ncbi:MAG TPA: hypothetical protein PLK30_11035 [Blastocatellia bacterium]|nr:hypothetical protein [Blastocatellia bacterium]
MSTAEITIEQVLSFAQTLKPLEQAHLISRLASLMETNVSILEQKQPMPRRPLHGILADLGPAPSAEEIDEARREMWANFPRDDF